MRIHIRLSKNRETVPFNYQEKQVSQLHTWIGRDNDLHGKLSLYSFSWLKKGDLIPKRGWNFPYGTEYFISSHQPDIIKKIIERIQQDNYFGYGMEVNSLSLQQDPYFEEKQRFLVGSPVFIKRKEAERFQFYFPGEERSDSFLTETLQTKLVEAGLPPEGVKVEFDKNYKNPTQNGVSYKGIFNKGSICPVIVSGSSEQVAFAWNVGVGNSTGIGFGALI